MLTLHGFAFSNYHNIVKHALMHKGIPFEEHIVYPGTPELLAVNPAGKVPAMTTEDGTPLAESSVLVDYLEDAYPAVPLYPAEPEARARVRQLMKVSELYLDLPSRRLLPAVLGNAAIDQAVKDEVRGGCRDITGRHLPALRPGNPENGGSEPAGLGHHGGGGWPGDLGCDDGRLRYSAEDRRRYA